MMGGMLSSIIVNSKTKCEDPQKGGAICNTCMLGRKGRFYSVYSIYIKKPQKGGAIHRTPPSDGHGILDDKKQLRPIYLSLMGFFSDLGHFTESVMG